MLTNANEVYQIIPVEEETNLTVFLVNLFVFIFCMDKNCELIEFINYHQFVLFFKLTSLLECAGEEPIEDIDIPVSGR